MNTSRPTCKGCNNQLETKRPDIKSGKITVCGYCTTIGKYDTQANIVPVSYSEMAGIRRNQPGKYELLFQARNIVLEGLARKQQNAC